MCFVEYFRSCFKPSNLVWVHDQYSIDCHKLISVVVLAIILLRLTANMFVL